MSVFRVEKNKNFTVMSNYHLKDTGLSLKAKGLLSLMLSLPDNWDYTIKGLATICKDGVDSIKSTVKELEQNGYILRKRIRNEKGHLRGIEYIIYEEPKNSGLEGTDTEAGEVVENQNNCTEETDKECCEIEDIEPKREKPLLVEDSHNQPRRENPILDKPKVDFPTVVEPTQGNHAQLNTKVINTNELNINLSNPNQSITNSQEIDRGIEFENKYNNYIELIKCNIEYEFLCANHKGSKDIIDEIIDIMAETICTSKLNISIGGELFPTEVVRSRFLKIDQFHMEYILDCLSKNTTKVNNIKNYLRTCIYNAPSTISNYYSAVVNHDLYTNSQEILELT